MSPRTKLQYEAIRESTRAKILSTALDFFANRGYFNTSIIDIANQAGISKGLVYNYFESKEHLFRTLVKESFDSILTLMDPNKDRIITKEEFWVLLNTIFNSLETQQNYWKLLFNILMQQGIPEMVAKEFSTFSQPYTNMLLNYFSHEGTKDSQAEVLFFPCLIYGIAINYVLNPRLFPLHVLKQKVFEIYHLNV